MTAQIEVCFDPFAGKEIYPLHPTLDLSELNSMIGQMFMSGIPGPVLDSETESLIRDNSLGGVILFSRNIETPVQLAALCNDLQEKAMESACGAPLFVAVDQEGGRVSRLKEPFTHFPGNTAIGEDPRAVDRAIEFASVTAKEMTLVGLNMNLAPVVDVSRGKPEKHLVGRTFSNRAETVALLGRTVTQILQANGVMAVAKHFPGLGSATMDPHHHLPTIDADMKELKEVNLPPFREAIMAGVSAVMTSHALYPSLDPDCPATLSHNILTRLLREDLGFQGLVITDDLEMGAIAKHRNVAAAATAAFEAGADILLICQDQDVVLEGMMALRQKVLKNEISFKRLHRSIERIRKAKSRFLKKTKKISLEDARAYFS